MDPITTALELLNTMVEGGERHSVTSHAAVGAAWVDLARLKRIEAAAKEWMIARGGEGEIRDSERYAQAIDNLVSVLEENL